MFPSFKAMTKKLHISLADTPSKRANGLMWIKKIGKNEGMLFKFPEKHNLCFWMQNTYVPLDIAFIDDEGEIFQIEELIPLSTKKIQASQACKLALEVPHGWFKENNVDVGNKVSLDVLRHKNYKFAQTEELTEDFLDSDPPLIDEEVPEDFELEEEVDEIDETPEDIEQPSPDLTEEPSEDISPKVELMRNKRDVIIEAQNNRQDLDISYWTLSGHVLPPRRLATYNGEYKIKSGPNGEYLIAYDKSPTISGAGWTIKGNQPKSFILQNIIAISPVEEAVQNEYEQIEEKRQSFWDKLKNIF